LGQAQSRLELTKQENDSLCAKLEILEEKCNLLAQGEEVAKQL